MIIRLSKSCYYFGTSHRKRRSSSQIITHHHRNISKQLLIYFVLILFLQNENQSCFHSSVSRSKCCGSSILVTAIACKVGDTDEKMEKDLTNVTTFQQDPHPVIRRLRLGFGVGASSLTTVHPSAYRQETKLQPTFSEILKKAGKSGMGGGVPGAIAGVTQVLTLMWLRTVMNYQCRYGATFPQALKILYNEGGIPRFYRGLSFALVQAPLARFVSTAANDGVETLLASLEYTKYWGPGRSTIIASIVVGIWRMLLMPVDTCKTVLQVDSVDGFRHLMRKVKAGNCHVLYQGAIANAISAIAAHYPWFYTYRVLSRWKFLQFIVESNLFRNAVIGFVSSVVSDTFANAIRVVKTTKQAIASKHTVSYGEVVAMIHATDGWKGLFGRGLRTRILGNAVQSILFTVIWRALAERWSNNDITYGKEGIKSIMDDISQIDLRDGNNAIEIEEVPMEEERN